MAKKIKLELSERETVINYNEETESVHIYTAMRSVITKLDKLVAKNPQVWKCVKEDSSVGAKWYVCEKNVISFREGKEPRQLSEDEIEKRRERMKIIRQNYA